VAVSLIVLSEELSSLPAATCASFVQPVGTFFVPSGKKLTVSAGQAADASCTEAAGQNKRDTGGRGWHACDTRQKLRLCLSHACVYRYFDDSTSTSSS
jgi:hypothetical protein